LNLHCAFVVKHRPNQLTPGYELRDLDCANPLNCKQLLNRARNDFNHSQQALLPHTLFSIRSRKTTNTKQTSYIKTCALQPETINGSVLMRANKAGNPQTCAARRNERFKPVRNCEPVSRSLLYGVPPDFPS
jgi:hypothetical protein